MGSIVCHSKKLCGAVLRMLAVRKFVSVWPQGLECRDDVKKEGWLM